jgi:hypothetical protein
MNEIEKAQLAQTTIQCLMEASGSLEEIPGLIAKVIEVKAWERRLHHGRLYELPSLRDLVTRKPPEGWGQNPDKIEALLKGSPEVLAAWREEMTNKPHVHAGDGDNVTIRPERGNRKSYTLSRLKRENAELFEQVVAGELSANAAAIKAGWRKPTVTIPLGGDPDRLARAFVSKLGKELAHAVATAIFAGAGDGKGA